MAFVWSRLALAAVLAVGGASPAIAGAAAGRCDEAPRLCCAATCPSAATIIADLDGDDGVGDAPLVAVTAIAVAAPHPTARDVAPPAPVAAPARARDVLEIAPKTSPPRS